MKLFDLRMPPEWAPHEATLMAWPVARNLIHPERHREIRAAQAAVANAIADFEPVLMLTNSEDLIGARRQLDGRIRLLELPHDDGWLRDSGPTVVFRTTAGDLGGRTERLALNWRFNAWGGKYPNWELDDRIPIALADALELDRLDVDLVLEGGSIHVDGAGLLLTTAECLLHSRRNPGCGQAGLEAELEPLLGCRSTIWLPWGIAGDETDGHVDNVACFLAPGRLLLQVAGSEDGENFERSKANRAALADWQQKSGRTLEVIEIEQPPVRRDRAGRRLAQSYINFYLANGAVIAPVFGGEAKATDERFLGRLAELLPDRRIVPVDGSELVTEGGSVHCITQQLPALPD